MARRELKDRNRKTLAYIADVSGSYVCEIQNIRYQTIGYIKEVQTRTRYEIQQKNRSVIGYAEYLGTNLELKNKSRRMISKVSSKFNITEDTVLLTILDTYFKGL